MSNSAPITWSQRHKSEKSVGSSEGKKTVISSCRINHFQPVSLCRQEAPRDAELKRRLQQRKLCRPGLCPASGNYCVMWWGRLTFGDDWSGWHMYASCVIMGFSGGASVKEPACQWWRYKRCVWSLGWEDSPEGGKGNPLQYSCLVNSADRGTW